MFIEFQEAFTRQHVSRLTVRREVEGVMRRYFPPLHAYRLAEINYDIVANWFAAIGEHSHAQANKALGILRTLFNEAKRRGKFHGDNPAALIRKFPRNQRTRFVKPGEMPNLMKALSREREDVQCYFLLCLLVGCRRGEALTLRWADIDIELGVWNKPNTKTGIPHTVPIPQALLHRLCQLPRINEWVFSTQYGHWSATLAFSRWEDIRKAAGLPDVTIHDLRRTCASWLAINGENLAVIGKGVLNHTSLAHTGIYARLNVNPVQKALETNSQRMLALVR